METSTDMNPVMIYPYPSLLEVLVLILIPIFACYVLFKLKQENFLKCNSQKQRDGFILIIAFVIFSISFQMFWFSPYWFETIMYDIFFFFPNFLPVIGILTFFVIYYFFNNDTMNNSNGQNNKIESEFNNQIIRIKTKKCSKCGKELECGALFCHNCENAISMEIRFCSYCGTRLLKNAIFCHECGNNINERNVLKKRIHAIDLEQLSGNGNRNERGNEKFYCPLCGNKYK